MDARVDRKLKYGDGLCGTGGEGEIRTHGSLATTAAFQAAGLNHSPTSPLHWNSQKVRFVDSEDKGISAAAYIFWDTQARL